MKGVSLYQGDCLDVMKTFKGDTFDSVITDPPYGLEFMGKEWDRLDGGGAGTSKPGIGERSIEWPTFGGQEFGGANPTCAKCRGRLRGRKRCSCLEPDWRIKGNPVAGGGREASADSMQEFHRAWAVEALRVAKPGALLLAFGGTRTFHRLACGIENAGWEIRDCLLWLYGSGFPKSLDISKAIDRAGSGTERKDWIGWGTALKPAWEPIVLAMKPLDRTFAENALRHGVAGLNIDDARVGEPLSYSSGAFPERINRPIRDGRQEPDGRAWARSGPGVSNREVTGRFPANVILDPEAGKMLDEQGGERPRGHAPRTRGKGGLGTSGHSGQADLEEQDFGKGGASRFFYSAKASKREREEGLLGRLPCLVCGSLDSEDHEVEGKRGECRRNGHPTVKPLALMQYLCRLTKTPTGGSVLDPFLGSGTTGVAALLEGRTFVGIERESESFNVARWRIVAASETPKRFKTLFD